MGIDLGMKRYRRTANYRASVDPCPMCDKVHPRINFSAFRKKTYAGIDDAGDDLEEWNWNYINGRCVISRRLKEGEAP